LSKEVVVNFNKKVMEKIAPEKLEVFKDVMNDILKIANDLNQKNRQDASFGLRVKTSNLKF
ncbi:MAG TPA: hypothetical protein PKV58_09870, partial [Kaistella sp.]|nr:hypothetical protein [Kaistella sp.]